MPLIIIEGADGSGKSTLAEAIIDLTKPGETGSLLHLGPPASPESAIDECLDPLYGYHITSPELVVFDRAHWGCPVYGSVYRPELDHDGYGDMGRAGWAYCELVYESRGAVTLLLDCDPELAAKRCAERGEDYIDLAHLPQLRSKYHDLFRESVTGIIQEQATVPADTHRIAAEVLGLARVKAKSRERFANWPHYVGTVTPSRLIVCPPSRIQRVEAIRQAMERGEPWQSLGIVSGMAGPADLDRLWEALGLPTVEVFGTVPDDVRRWADDETEGRR